MIRRQRDFPRELVIGESVWRIRFVRSIPEPPDCRGLCDPSEHTIYILQGLSPMERFKTFIHELCHALCEEWQIRECHRTIYRLEEPIARLLKDNGID